MTPHKRRFTPHKTHITSIFSKQSGEAARDDAEKFYKVAKAAMNGGNTFVAQENMARALGAIESYNRRRKRSEDNGRFHSTSLWSYRQCVRL